MQKVKILARDVSESASMWRKARRDGWTLSAFSVLLLSDTLDYVSMCIISIFLDRSDEAILNMLIT